MDTPQKQPEASKEQSADKLAPPRRSATIHALLKLNKIEHPIAKKFLDEYAKYQEHHDQIIRALPTKQVHVLPELKPIDLESFYDLFRSAFKFFQKKDFDESANNYEARKLARTLCAYFGQRKSFLRSPLLTVKSIPSLDKGIMMVGGYGIGKTAIMNTFHMMFKTAATYPVEVRDISGTIQIFGRYKMAFGYHTANDLVKTYESLASPDEKKFFWDRLTNGTKYFDDIMTESTASNFGKVEIFKDIFEMRYTNSAKTLISLNYAGSLDDTLDAFSDKYGERLYDRTFEMFNIIELKGESLRE